LLRLINLIELKFFRLTMSDLIDESDNAKNVSTNHVELKLLN